MAYNRRCVIAEAVVFDPDIITEITPMSDLGMDMDAPTYLLSGVLDERNLSRLNMTVLARHLAPILFPEAS